MSAHTRPKGAAVSRSGLGYAIAIFGGLAAAVVLAASIVAHAVLNMALTA